MIKPIIFASLVWLTTSVIPLQAVEKSEKNANVATVKNEQKANEPLFKDGKGYYTYRNKLPPAKRVDGKIPIQYFFKYDCKVCLAGDDFLKLYAERNADKVVLERSPTLDKGEVFTAQMHASFVEFGRPELSDLYLFDSVDRKEKQSLTKNNEEIKRWLERNSVDVAKFGQVFASQAVKNRVQAYANVFKQFRSPPYSPIAIVNNEYILLQNTLYNDDYTYAVLDFLIEKINKQKEETK